MPNATLTAIADAVHRHAYANYTDSGWARIVEGWTTEDIAEALAERDIATEADAIEFFTVGASIYQVLESF